MIRVGVADLSRLTGIARQPEEMDVVQKACDEDTPDASCSLVQLMMLGITDNNASPDEETYQFTYDICPSSEWTYFVQNRDRIALRIAYFCLTDAEGLQLT